MDDEQWHWFRREQERTDLEARIGDALDQVPSELAVQLRADFDTCLEEGGLDAVYMLVDRLSHLFFPQVHPLVVEHFVEARVPPKELTQRERDGLARQQRRVAKKLREASEAAQAVAGSPSWSADLANALDQLADGFSRRAAEAESSRGSGSPGRRIRAGTRLALGLDVLFREPEIPTAERCRLIAGVVSAFVEPVSGEQVRQRIKDHLRRRPPSS